MTDNKELEIKFQFLEEAKDRLNTIEAVLLQIKNNRQIDIQNINNAMRAAHSIKGGAAIMGFTILSEFSHKLEDLFKVLKTKPEVLEINHDWQSLLLSSVDGLRDILHFYLEDNRFDIELISQKNNLLLAQLHDILGDAIPEDATTILAAEENLQDIIPLIFQTQVEECLQHLETVLEENQHHNLREELVEMTLELGGLGQMLQIEAFTQLCESVTSHLMLANTEIELQNVGKLALEAWRHCQTLILTNQFDNLPNSININNLEQTLEKNREHNSDKYKHKFTDSLSESNQSTSSRSTFYDDNTIAITSSKTESIDNTVRVPGKQLEVINDLSSELKIQRESLNLKLDSFNELIRHLNHNIEFLSAEFHEVIKKQPQLKTLLAQITKLQETAANIHTNLLDTEQTNHSLNKTAQHLHNSLTQVLMRPLSDILERFPRALHDLSIEYNKPVELKIKGKDTLIERSILDALQEPLLHIVRNAFDHGIEDPVTRKTLGKPETGLIEITATHSQNHIIVTVRDDGRGIALDKIHHRAIEIGLDASLLAQASDDELVSLIFEPGFSTTEEVTTLSGRGVGMDVVRNNLNNLNGNVKVHTEEGKGTIFTLSVPFNVSVIRVLLIECNKMLLASPTSTISEIFLLREEQIFFIASQEYIHHNNNTLRLIRLSENLHFNSHDYKHPYKNKIAAINSATVLIVNYDNQDVAILVERCWGEQETAIRQVEGNIPLPTGFVNCTIIGDGHIIPIINWKELLTSIDTLLAVKTEADFIKTKSTILIIDDSINVRHFLEQTLEKAGYQVEQANDGLEALEKLQAGLPVQAIICDLDMPRLDGFGFLARVTANIELKHIPVIILSSQTSERHRHLAMQLGAKAYFCKPYNEHELLQELTHQTK